MSRMPGIGRDWYDKYQGDVFPHDQVILRQGLVLRPPKYFDKLFESSNPRGFAEIKAKRRNEAEKHSGDSTDFRLRVREAIKNKQFNLLVRPVERSTYDETTNL